MGLSYFVANNLLSSPQAHRSPLAIFRSVTPSARTPMLSENSQRRAITLGSSIYLTHTLALCVPFRSTYLAFCRSPWYVDGDQGPSVDITGPSSHKKMTMDGDIRD